MAIDLSWPLDVSIVYVSWNVRVMLEESIASVLRNVGDLKIEIIVVDNASIDGTVASIRRRFPCVTVVENRTNAGFAKANNQGFALAQGKYVLALNPDTLVRGGAITKLKEWLDLHTTIGAVGPSLLWPTGEIQIISARLVYSLGAALWWDALRFHRIPFLRNLITRKFISPYDYSKAQPVEAISGAAMLVRHDLLSALGGFEESFLFCGEDVDLCVRARKLGYEVYFLPEAEILHYGGQSSIQAPLRSVVNGILSDELFIRKTFGKNKARVFRLISCFLRTPAMIVTAIAKYAVGVESGEVLQRKLKTAVAILRWRPVP